MKNTQLVASCGYFGLSDLHSITQKFCSRGRKETSFPRCHSTALTMRSYFLCLRSVVFTTCFPSSATNEAWQTRQTSLLYYTALILLQSSTFLCTEWGCGPVKKKYFRLHRLSCPPDPPDWFLFQFALSSQSQYPSLSPRTLFIQICVHLPLPVVISYFHHQLPVLASPSPPSSQPPWPASPTLPTPSHSFPPTPPESQFQQTLCPVLALSLPTVLAFVLHLNQRLPCCVGASRVTIESTGRAGSLLSVPVVDSILAQSSYYRESVTTPL